MTSGQPYQGTEYKVFHGRALVVVRTSATAGAIDLTAQRAGPRAGVGPDTRAVVAATVGPGMPGPPAPL